MLSDLNGDMDGQDVRVGWYKGKYVSEKHPPYVAWVKQKQSERIARTLEK